MNRFLSKSNIIQFLIFGIVGFSNTVVSMSVYSALVYFGIHYIIANVFAFIFSVLNSFFWNDRFVFNENKTPGENKGRIVVRTFLVYGCTIILVSNVLSYIWINFLGISKFISPIINLCISVPLNFILNKYWAFRR